MVRFFVGVLGVCAVATGLHVLIEAAFNPWARSLTGAATLTGEWLGVMTTSTGAKRLVWLEIEHAVPSTECFGCPRIEGHAATCSAKEKTRQYEIWGSVEDWNGTLFHLKARENEESEVHLLYLDGKWAGDEISLTTTLVAPGIPQATRWERNEAGEETTTVIGGHPDTRAPITFSMKPGRRSDFEARCKAGVV
jgi:hypothetical protein